MEKTSEYEGEDRISNLPESIVEHIPSFLSLEEAVQASVLSKRWRQLWRISPVVEFDFPFLWSTVPLRPSKKQEVLQRRRKMFDNLERILKHRVVDKISMKRFAICTNTPDSESESFVHRCISYAVLQSSVKELKLDVYCYGTSFYAPPVLLSAESLEVLELSRCFHKSKPPTSNVKLPRLIKLHLDDESVIIWRRYSFKGEEIWEELLNNLPNLDFTQYYR